MVKTPSLGVRLQSELKSALEKASSDDLRSMSSMVEKILTLYLTEHGYLKQPKKASKR